MVFDSISLCVRCVCVCVCVRACGVVGCRKLVCYDRVGSVGLSVFSKSVIDSVIHFWA